MVGTNTHTFNAIRGRQASRNFYTAMCTLKSVAKIFTFNDVDIPAEHRAQRTLRKSRIPRIRDYILQNPDDYTFSSITVSVDGKITFNPISQGKNADIGTISISQNVAVLINDGQHRAAAIREAIQNDAHLGTDDISVVFFEDMGLQRSQQMFADLNKHAVKPTKSLGILYDRRNDFSAFVVEMTRHVKGVPQPYRDGKDQHIEPFYEIFHAERCAGSHASPARQGQERHQCRKDAGHRLLERGRKEHIRMVSFGGKKNHPC